jgi:hypothetical protein
VYYYHTPGPKLEASSLTRHLAGLGLKIVQVRYEVVTAVSVDILGCCTVWSSPVGIDMCFRGAYCLHHQGSECGELLKCFKNVQVKYGFTFIGSVEA